jgi:prepilin-type N-terminal cleavage/methylation domain-containing protein
MYNTLRRIREEKAAEDRGFTLIELLVVVVIIGILVAIAIPLYLNYKNGAENKSVQSDLRNAAPLVEQSFSDSNAYPADNAAFDLLKPHFSADTTSHTYTLVSAGDWCLQASNSHDTFHYDNTVGKVMPDVC